MNKPKRKIKPGRNPKIYLGVGIILGVVLAALAVLLFVGIGWSSVDVSSSQIVVGDAAMGAAGMSTVSPSQVEVRPTVISSRVQAAQLSPDGDKLAAIVLEDAAATLYLSDLNVADNLVGQRLPVDVHIGLETELFFNPSSDQLIVPSVPSAVVVNTISGEVVRDLLLPYTHAAYSPDATMVALGSAMDGIWVMKPYEFEVLNTSPIDGQGLIGLAFTPGNELLVAKRDLLELWKPLLNQMVTSYPLSAPVYDVALHPDGEWVAVAGDGSVQVIHLGTGEVVYYPFDAPRINSVAFSEDGAWLTAGGGDGGLGIGGLFILRWEQNSIIPPDPEYYSVQSLGGHQHTIMDVMFSAGRLLSAAWDGSIRLWDYQNQQEISRLQL